MLLYRISSCDYINDFSGTGAAMYGGRWNSKGTYILYTAGSSSLALLESVVHITRMPPNGYCLLTLSLPDIPVEELDIQKLPVDWQKFPPPDFLKNYGDSFVRKYDSVVLKVPSVILPNESNYLLNPNHPDFKLIEKISVQPLPIDSRLVKEKDK